MNRLLSLLVTAVLVAALRADARACSVAGPTPYVVDASMQATDHVAPTLEPLSIASLQRGTATGGACSGSSCDGMGSLALTIAASDDVTPANNLGYRFSLAAGALPASFFILLDQPSQVTVSDGKIWFNWDDGTEDHAPIDFTLQMVAIDRAGNRSAPQMVRVTDDPGGCAIARPHPRGLACIVAAALLLARRRRR
jgi:hypothetical protein